MSKLATLILGVASLAHLATAQVNKANSLTPDAYFHNRYHALLTMAAYGDFNTTCPSETFTEESKLRNFPDSQPWTVINEFGPTPSGASGFTAIVPEMNKALIIFRGNYALEQNISQEVVGWDKLDENLNGVCNYFAHGQAGLPDENCTVNAFALQGYLEAKQETNDWEAILGQYSGAGLVFSIAGHGLGGMHSIIAALDLNHQNIAYYHHTYGTPRTLNAAGAWYYNYNFWAESGERGIANNDQYTESIPAGPDYAHAGTPFYYSGWNNTASGPAWEICFDVDDPACTPRQQGNSTSEEDHYFYFANVGGCGGDDLSVKVQNLTVIDNFLEAQNLAAQVQNQQAAASSQAAAAAAASSSSQAQTAASASAPSTSQNAVNAKSSSPLAATTAPLGLLIMLVALQWL